MNNNLDQSDSDFILEMAKLYFEAGAVGVSYCIAWGKNWTENINEAVKYHQFRQTLPLLGDEQKEI